MFHSISCTKKQSQKREEIVRTTPYEETQTGTIYILEITIDKGYEGSYENLNVFLAEYNEGLGREEEIKRLNLNQYVEEEC